MLVAHMSKRRTSCRRSEDCDLPSDASNSVVQIHCRRLVVAYAEADDNADDSIEAIESRVVCIVPLRLLESRLARWQLQWLSKQHKCTARSLS
jgi:hypothetical protein